MNPNRRSFLSGISVGVLFSLVRSHAAPASASSATSVSPSGPGKLKKVADVDVYRNPKYYCGPGPSPLALPDGKVLMAFRRSLEPGHFHPEVEMCLLVSADGGRTWLGEPEVFDFGPITNANLTLLRDGTILYATHADALLTTRIFDRLKANPRNARVVYSYDAWTQLPKLPLAEGKPRPTGSEPEWSAHAAKTGTYVRRSRDNGRTWGPPFWVSPIEGMRSVLPGMPSPSAIRNPAFVLADGSLVIPVYGVDTPETAYLMESPDCGGLRWRLRGVIARPQEKIGFNETVLYQCASGKLVAFMRTSEAGGYTFIASSTDGGRQWSRPKQEELWGFPCTAVRMPSGRVLVAYGYRREPFGVRARLVDAECEHIGQAEELVLRDDGGTRDLGYPLATLLPDGTALIAYYFNSKADLGRQVYITASLVQEVS